MPEEPVGDAVDDGLVGKTQPKTQQNPASIVPPMGDVKRDYKPLQSMYASSAQFISEGTDAIAYLQELESSVSRDMSQESGGIRSVSYSTTSAKSAQDRWPASDADDGETTEPNPLNRSPPEPPVPISGFALFEKRLNRYGIEEVARNKLEPKHATTGTTKRILGDDEGAFLEDGDLEGDDSAESSRDCNLEDDADREENALYYNLAAMKKIDVMLVGVTKSLFKTKAILHTGMEFNWISSEILSKLGYDTNALQRKSHGPTTMSISVHYDGFAGIPIREVLFLVASNGNWEVILGQEFITTEGILSRPSSDVSKEMNIPNTPLNPSPGYESKTTTLSNIHVPSVSPSNIKEVEPNIEPHQEIRHDPAPSGSKSPPTSHGSPKYNDEYDISLISFDDDVDQALSGDPWYPLFPPEDQAEQPQLSQFPLPFDEVIEPRQVPKLSKPNLSQQYELLTPPNLDLSLSGIFSRKRDKPLPPIIVEDPNDTVAMKRARNTLAARKSRQRKMQRFEELEEHIAKLESERDHWKEKAIGLPRSQMSSSNPVGPHYALADDVSQQGILQEKVEQNASYTQLLARVDKSDADTVFSTSKDSGYGTTVSSIRPTAPTIKKTTDDSAKWESQSVASVEMSGTMQTMSSVNPAAAGGAAEELAETLIRDELVYSLIVEGYQNFDPDRFERNFNRILERFAHGLKREAGNDLEKSAVRLVYNYRAYVIRVIRKRLALVQDEHATNLDELKTQQASKVALERFLEQIPGAERSSDPIFGNQEDEEDKVQESDPSESEISNDEQPHLRNLENVKLYLTSSRAYSELKQQLLAFVRPSSDITVLEVEDELPTTSTDIENHASEIVGSDMVEALERNPHEFDSQASELCHDSQDSLIIAIVKFLESLLNIDDGNRIDVRASQGREISLIAEKIEQDALLPRKDDLASQGSIIFQSELQSEPEKLQMGDMGTSVLNQQRVIYHDSGTQTELSDDLTRQTKTWNAFANHLPSLSKRLIILHNWWARSMRKPVKQGHTRIEWTCTCGHELYADFSTHSKEKLDQYSAILKSVPSGQSNTGSAQFTNDNLSIPPTAYPQFLGPSSTASSITTSQRNSTVIRRLPTSSSMISSMNPSYLELCVNTGAHLKTLGEIDLSGVSTDGALFQAVKKKYLQLRGFRSRFWLLTPASVSFVRFSLENRHRVGILQKPLALPPKSEVDAKKWVYEPCPLEGDPPIPEDLFLHYLSCSEPSSSLFWMLRFPRKLETSLLTAAGASTAFGWGVHIDEGPDYGAVFKANFLVLLVSGAAAWLWDYMRDDFQGAFGFACWIIAVLNSLLMAYMFKWRQE